MKHVKTFNRFHKLNEVVGSVSVRGTSFEYTVKLDEWIEEYLIEADDVLELFEEAKYNGGQHDLRAFCKNYFLTDATIGYTYNDETFLDQDFQYSMFVIKPIHSPEMLHSTIDESIVKKCMDLSKKYDDRLMICVERNPTGRDARLLDSPTFYRFEDINTFTNDEEEAIRQAYECMLDFYDGSIICDNEHEFQSDDGATFECDGVTIMNGTTIDLDGEWTPTQSGRVETLYKGTHDNILCPICGAMIS